SALKLSAPLALSGLQDTNLSSIVLATEA
ncbi:MAG: hypothetical protein JWQ03_3041, partial [Variovorax sp.]|nr:hypothetical protein [Variovorax sp.]